MSFREIKPTKTNLIRLQKKLEFAQKGEFFLEYKLEQLLFQIEKYKNVYQKYRNECLNLYKQTLRKLFESYEEMGKRAINLISNVSKIQYRPEVNIKYRKVVGILLVNIEYDLKEKVKLPAYSFQDTSRSFDELIILLRKFFQLMIQLAETEDTMLKLSLNYKKINRRVNGLKNIIIPQLSLEVKIIKDILEEIERENFVRLKKTKDLINKKKMIETGG
ncbi:MAG: V-type ATP synthase subunit D [Promethearchaeota archaeon]